MWGSRHLGPYGERSIKRDNFQFIVWRRSAPKDAPPEPFKHLIDRYQHREQLVTCTCGWVGSSSDTVPDGWKAHLLEVRGLPAKSLRQRDSDDGGGFGLRRLFMSADLLGRGLRAALRLALFGAAWRQATTRIALDVPYRNANAG